MRDRLRQPPRRARLLTAAAALAAATTIAACGSTSSPPASGSSGSTSTASQALAFSKCMRADGVPNFPDLSSNGMRITGSEGTISVNGVSLNGPAYRAARAKCQKYMPTQTAASPSQQEQAQQRARELRFARCMRSHGVPNFPDPKVVSSHDGNQQVYLPGVNPYAPAFQTAAKACGGGPKGP